MNTICTSIHIYHNQTKDHLKIPLSIFIYFVTTNRFTIDTLPIVYWAQLVHSDWTRVSECDQYFSGDWI